MIGAVQFAVDQIFAPEHLPLWLDQRSPAGRPGDRRARALRRHRLTRPPWSRTDRSGGGSASRPTRRGRAPGGTGWTATSIPRASGSTSSGCTGSACAASRCSTAAWALRSSSRSRCSTGRPSGATPSGSPPTTAQRLGPRVRGRDLGRLERGGRAVGRAGRRDEEGRLVRDAGRRAAGPVEQPLRAAARRRRARTRTAPRWGADPTPTGSRRTGWSLAVPAEQVARRAPSRPSVAGVRAGRRLVVPGRRQLRRRASRCPRDPDGPSTAWLEQVFDEPVTVGRRHRRTARRRAGSAPRRRRTPCWRPATTASPTASVAELAAAVGPADKAVPVRTVAFPPVTGAPVPAGAHRRERRRGACPRLAEGVRAAAGAAARCRSSWSSEFALFGRRARAPGRAQGGLRGRARLLRPRHDPARRRRRSTRPACVDVTGTVDDDGVLRWDAPAGRAGWILRFGASLTGQTNGPAAAGGDRPRGRQARRRTRSAATSTPTSACFDGVGHRRAAQRQHRVGPAELHRPAARAVHRAARLRPAAVAARARRLRRRRRRAHPTGSSGTTGARSPTCWRASTTARSRRRPTRAGSTYYAEALEDHRPQLGDDLAMRSHADVPMGAMWMFDAGTGEPEPDLPRRPQGRLVGRARVRQAVHRRGVDDRVPPAVELHPAAAQARRRPRAGPRRHPVLHPHLAAPADAGAAARHRPRALPRAGVHPHRAVGRAGRAVDRLPRPLLVAAQPGRRPPSTSPSSSARRRRSPRCSATEPDRTRPGRASTSTTSNLDALEDRFAVDDGDLVAGDGPLPAAVPRRHRARG